MMRANALMAALLFCWVALPAAAVEPDEVLDDPALEERAREISEEVRCLVCRNESIDSSNAPLAKDLRVLVRERLEAGDTDAEVKDYLVDRYGEYVLLKPRLSTANAFLWLSGPLLLVIGGAAAWIFLKSRGRAAETVSRTAEAPLSPEEEAELERILRRDANG